VRYGEFENEFLVATYREAEIRPNTKFSSAEILDRYPLRWKEGWVHQLVADLGRRGLIRGRGVDADERSQPIMLTANGMKEAEKLIDAGIGTFRLDEPEPAKGVGDDDVAELHTNDDAAGSVDSSRWTGRTARIAADPTLLDRIRIKVIELDRLVEEAHLSNAETARAKAITRALVTLVESPNPEWEAISQLLSSPAFSVAIALAGLAQLILSIMLT
jgi:DNA-binding MarR family transcriptional regulator